MKLYQVYELYQNDLQKYAYSLCRQWEDAEDLVHQAYMKALEQYELFETMHLMQIKGWLYTTIKRLFVDSYRRQKRMRYMDDVLEMPYDAQIEAKLVASDLISQLPEASRVVVYLKYVEGYNSAEIGDILKLNASTVRSRLSQAMKYLRSLLEDSSL